MSSFTLLSSYIQARLNEKKSSESIRRLQEKKFRKLLKYAFHHSSFYHDLYCSHGISEQDLDGISLEKLPVVDKESMMNHFDEVLTVEDVDKKGIVDFLEKSVDPSELYHQCYHVVHSSGSSGLIGIFVYSRKEWDSFFPYITRIYNVGFKKNKSVFFGAAGGHFLGVSFSAWLGIGLSRFFVDSCILDITKPIASHLSRLNEYQPSILGGYFSGLKILADEQASGRLRIHPDVVVNCGEGIVVKDMKYIQRVFDAPMVNLYGLAECPIMGAGRQSYEGMYLMDDIVLVEIRKDHALVTNLINKTQPLIRYKINDFFSKKVDKYGRMPFTLVDNIVGRRESLLWLETDEGRMDFIHPIVFAEFFVKGLDRFQIVVHDAHSFDFVAVLTDKDEEVVVNKIREKLDSILVKKGFSRVHYSVRIVDGLSVDPKTGKFKLIIEKN